MSIAAPIFANNFYILTAGAQRSTVSELFLPGQRSRWLDGWGSEDVPGLTIQVKAKPSKRGIFESIIVVNHAQPVTPEQIAQAAFERLRFYHEMLRWDRALHYYLATGQHIPAALARDAGQYQFPPYADAGAIEAIVADFEAALLPVALWKHEQHLAAIAWYLLHYDQAEAHARFRAHAQQMYQRYPSLNPYHETITCFWVRWVNACLGCIGRDQPVVEIVNRIIRACAGSKIAFQYYSQQTFFSDIARQTYVEPDLAPFDFEPMPALPVNEGYRPFTVPIQTVHTPGPLTAQQIQVSLDDRPKGAGDTQRPVATSPATRR